MIIQSNFVKLYERSKSTPSFLKPVSGARSQKEGVDVDSSESKGVTNVGKGEDF